MDGIIIVNIPFPRLHCTLYGWFGWRARGSTYTHTLHSDDVSLFCVLFFQELERNPRRTWKQQTSERHYAMSTIMQQFIKLANWMNILMGVCTSTLFMHWFVQRWPPFLVARHMATTEWFNYSRAPTQHYTAILICLLIMCLFSDICVCAMCVRVCTVYIYW